MLQRFSAMAAIAIAVLAIAPVSAEAVDMTLRGRFTCNDGQPLASEKTSGPVLRLWVLPGIHSRGGPGWVSTLGASSDRPVALSSRGCSSRKG